MPANSAREHATDQTRDHILTAARQVLGRNPDAGMAEIASAAGVVRRTVYGHFPSRGDLVATLASQAAGEMVAALDQAMASWPDSPERAWAKFVARLWPLTSRYRVLVALRRGPYGERIHALLQHVDHRLTDLVEQGQAAGVFGQHLPAATLSQLAFTAVFSIAAAELPEPTVSAQAAAITSLIILGVPQARAESLAHDQA